MLCFSIVVKHILSFTQFWRIYKKETAFVVNKSSYQVIEKLFQSNLDNEIIISHFGSSLFIPADFLRNSIILMFAP